MSKYQKFSPAVVEHLGYYVYLLIRPETDEVFYIGKGTGNRIFTHLYQAIDSPHINDKLETIHNLNS